MVGPHIFGFSPVSRSIIAATSFASARRLGLGTESRKAPTSASVGWVLFAAISPPLPRARRELHPYCAEPRRRRLPGQAADKFPFRPLLRRDAFPALYPNCLHFRPD